MTEPLQLTIERGPMVGECFEIAQSTILIGRDATCDFVIPDPLVSRHHAQITLQDETYVIQDMGSTNKTFVNGLQISTPTPLKSGDLINLGKTVTLSFGPTEAANVTLLSIDKAQTQKQVADITNDNYFQQLQKQAQQIRRTKSAS